MDNNYQNPPANQVPSPDPKSGAGAGSPEFKFAQRYRQEKTVPPRKPLVGKSLLAVFGLVFFFALGLIGVLIAQKQYLSRAPVAPTAPTSIPQAAIEQANCTLTFTVPGPTPTPTPTPEPNECGYTPCETNDECEGSLVCITADDNEGYCAVAAYEEACAENPSVDTCCLEPTPTPTPTPEIIACGETDCQNNFDCEASLICITADNGNNYCGEPEFKVACADNPSQVNCCEEPETSITPTPTPTPATTSGQPDFPEELPVAGPQDWLRYLQVGLATLGMGALLLLLL
ncbi:MAG TPA: hypothetical protein VGA89_00795 [Patescibacteria group bacterium]|jgi:hypothetical protein